MTFTVPVDWDPPRVDQVAALLRLTIARQVANSGHQKAMLFAEPTLPAPVRWSWLAARVTNKRLRHVM